MYCELVFVFLFCTQLITCSVKPYKKYPYVYLLDIGDEGFEATKTDKIRLSLPGGSLAIRYPAVGNGDLVTHVRVSGVDFGTDLQANVIDGGPGNNYLVLVLMGNPDVNYDVLLTVKTLQSENQESNENEKNSEILINPDETYLPEVKVISSKVENQRLNENEDQLYDYEYDDENKYKNLKKGNVITSAIHGNDKSNSDNAKSVQYETKNKDLVFLDDYGAEAVEEDFGQKNEPDAAFEVEEILEGNGKDTDSNNNYYDTDSTNAVEY